MSDEKNLPAEIKVNEKVAGQLIGFYSKVMEISKVMKEANINLNECILAVAAAMNIDPLVYAYQFEKQAFILRPTPLKAPPVPLTPPEKK